MNTSIINPNYDLLPGSYLFSTIAQKIKEYQGTHANADIIRLGIGDVTTPLIPEVIKAFAERKQNLEEPVGDYEGKQERNRVGGCQVPECNEFKQNRV